MNELTPQERARLILFGCYDAKDFITLTDKQTKQKSYITINK